MTKQKHNPIALLIDCDNASHKHIESIITDLASKGSVDIRKAYGNWAKQNLKGWVEKLPEHFIQPIQQFDKSKGKNASDIAIIIDAMDILYTKDVSAFAIISSDGDFTPLATRLRQDSIAVYGYGNKGTPPSFVSACTEFIFFEALSGDLERGSTQEQIQLVGKESKELKGDTKLINTLRKAVDEASDEDGWANLAYVGSIISRTSSDSPKNHGYKTWSALFGAIDLFEVKKDSNVVYVKDKRSK